ncbi:glutamine--fructose-6-phosphate aminotransferase, partial [bacterium]|nr:glutamine--fructose-6-phosphate aminotransferase [bacterium]
MCGIVGVTGTQEAASILIEGLKRLEYRGYDSAGIAIQRPHGQYVVKEQGKIKNLEASLDWHQLKGTCGIAHTRWATHGVPNRDNAHPHIAGKIALVHNGIIENYAALKVQLGKKGRQFSSETDTEVLVHLIDDLYTGDLVTAVQKALAVVDGAFGIAG